MIYVRMKTIFTTMLAVVAIFSLTAQEKKVDSLNAKEVILDEVMVSAIRVTKALPITFSNLDKEDLKSRNLGQDIPVLLNFLPSVVTTTDAGAGIGYTGIRVRGSDASRVNVTINGIPYNDAESQGTFWVNMPDFASSTESLQLQRGVGSSTNGGSAFGASLNLLTDAVSDAGYASISGSVGSFNTLKSNLKFSTGLLNDHIEISGRLSRITSDGYIDRASSSLNSFFLQGAYRDDNTLIKALFFGGHEVTYQSWNGIESDDLINRRTYNSAGKYTDENGVTQFHDNEVDDYKQNHFQLLWNQKISQEWNTNLAIHYTRGRGFFEQYKEDQDFGDYLLDPIVLGGETINTTDLIRRRWLDNHFYGTTFSVTYTSGGVSFITGGAYNKYEGDHFGETIWARYASNSEIGNRYYDDASTKTDFNIYSKLSYRLNKWSLFGDLQYRKVGYSSGEYKTGLVDDDFDFFNPKAGVSYFFNDINSLYFSFAHAHREPNRNDYEGNTPKAEKLNDFELGWRHVSSRVQLNANLYYMGYQDQLVLTGGLNDVGAPLRENSGKSYRAGLELDANINITKKLNWIPNVAISQSKNKDFVIDRDDKLTALGNTNISFSPELVIGSVLKYTVLDGLDVSLLTKYVGEQYLSNTDTEASKLDSYSTTDFNVSYAFKPKAIFKSIVISGLVNNVFNKEYVSNGYTYLDSWSTPGNTTEVQGYYPQAGTNFLVGATFGF